MITRTKHESGLPDWLEALEGGFLRGLDLAREAMCHAENIHEDTSCQAMGFMAEAIRRARASENYATALRRAEVFSGDPRGPYKLSTLVARYILDVSATSDDAQYERARSYAVVANYFADTDYSPSRVAKYLHKHGIGRSIAKIEKALAEGAAAGREAREGREDILRGAGHELNEESGDSSARNGAVVGTPQTNLSRAEVIKRALEAEHTPKPRRPKFDPRTQLVVDASDLQLRRALNKEVDDVFTLTVRREPNHDVEEWKRFTILAVTD